eukprot:TRINITY_DN6767_c0_g1_i4.p1 TRINITY_DN6767_c0_g1~~TRINITY_DN6767_c0_g1_i4.p1  ORF type:complete len:458 (+),score=143.60 TRINITY_DN6767_c0_g1_i4:2380-3753(+)
MLVLHGGGPSCVPQTTPHTPQERIVTMTLVPSSDLATNSLQRTTALYIVNMELPLDISANLSYGGSDMFNNQAVLGALSSLQQKIKRLEQERDYYMDSAEKARQHIESYKAETELLREQERRQQEERERQREEDFRKLREDRPRIEMELHHVQDKALHTERLLDSEREEFNAKLSEIIKMRDRLKEENHMQLNRLKHLEAQIEVESKARQVTLEEKEQAKSNIAELITLNECLFRRLQEAERPVMVKKSKPQKSSMSKRGRSCSIGHERHTASSSRRAKVSPRRHPSPQNTSLNIHDKLKRINQGEIPFVPAGKAVWGESFNQMARVQNGLDLSCLKDVRRTTPPRRVKVEPSTAVEEVYARFAREYDSISRRYTEELEKMRTAGEVDLRVVDRMRTLADELHSKGEDMKALYEHDCKVQEQLYEVHRPPYIRGLEKRTKTLELFEEMKRIHSMASS